ncbi:MAG: dTMP kinase [Candidatus Bathyarchaeota archaeon]|nr:MAG: dTMP kinase [Candidatus Bathyarchaeota archaeon]
MPRKRKGVFICIEGIDGSGKTTQAHLLVETLKIKAYDAIYTTEPSNGILGQMIRRNMLQGSLRVPTIVEAVFFAADRVDHIEKEIELSIKAEKIVVCDRYVYSSIAYQGASNINLGWIEQINRYAIKPDLAIYIDVPPEIVFKRMKRRKSVMETPHIQKKVRRNYLKLVKEKHLEMVDGNHSINQVAKTIENIVLRFLEKH